MQSAGCATLPGRAKIGVTAAVERLVRAPIMSRFHGMWSVGALAGALIGAACVGAGIGLLPQLAVLGVVALVVVEALTRRLIPDWAAGPNPGAWRPRRAWMTAIRCTGAFDEA